MIKKAYYLLLCLMLLIGCNTVITESGEPIPLTLQYTINFLTLTKQVSNFTYETTEDLYLKDEISYEQTEEIKFHWLKLKEYHNIIQTNVYNYYVLLDNKQEVTFLMLYDNIGMVDLCTKEITYIQQEFNKTNCQIPEDVMQNIFLLGELIHEIKRRG